MRGTRRGRKLRILRCGTGDRGAAVPRPDQAIGEAALGLGRQHPNRRRGDTSRRRQERYVTERAKTGSGVRMGRTGSRCFRNSTVPIPAESFGCRERGRARNARLRVRFRSVGRWFDSSHHRSTPLDERYCLSRRWPHRSGCQDESRDGCRASAGLPGRARSPAPRRQPPTRPHRWRR